MPPPNFAWVYPGEHVRITRSNRNALIAAVEARSEGLYVRLEPEGEGMDDGWFSYEWVTSNCRPARPETPAAPLRDTSWQHIDPEPRTIAPTLARESAIDRALDTLQRERANQWLPNIGSRFVWGGSMVPSGQPIYGRVTGWDPATFRLRFQLEGHYPEAEADYDTFMGSVVSWISDDVYLTPYWIAPGRVLALRDAGTDPFSVVEELWTAAEGIEPLVRLRQLGSAQMEILRCSEIETRWIATPERLEPIDNERTLALAAQATLERLPQAFGAFQETLGDMSRTLQNVGPTLNALMRHTQTSINPLVSRKEPERRRTAYERLLEDDDEG